MLFKFKFLAIIAKFVNLAIINLTEVSQKMNEDSILMIEE
jgi:hypothetical protein